MSVQVVADSGIFIANVMPERLSKQADDLIRFWNASQVQIIAPTLFQYEVVAVMRKSVYRGILPITEAAKVRAELQQLISNITFTVDDGLLQRGYELAEKLGRPTAYDSQYLAVAERLGCEFWTADERLFNAIKNDFPLIRWLGNFTPTT